MPKELLRSYLVASASETHSQRTTARAPRALLSCFTNTSTPPTLFEHPPVDINRETVQALCSEDSLQSWFDPLTLSLDKGRVMVGFPHAFFGIRFFKLFQAFFEHMARALWGEQILFSYSGFPDVAPEPAARPAPVVATSPKNRPETTQTPSPDLSDDTAPVAPSDRLPDALSSTSALVPHPENRPEGMGVQLPESLRHPALENPLPFGEEWTFDTFISNGKYKWALSLTRELTRKAVYRATHLHYYGTTSTPDESDPPGLLVLCGPHGTGKTHLLRAVGNELFRTLGNELLYASLSDLELRFATASPLTVRQELASKSAILLDDFQHLARIPSCDAFAARATAQSQPLPSREDETEKTIPVRSARTVQSVRTGLRQSPQQGDPKADLQEELRLLLDRFMDQGKPVVIAGVGHPKDWNLDRALSSRLETGLWAELPEPDLDVRLRYAQQQAKLRRLTLPREHLLLLAQHCQDIRRLSGVILRVTSHRSLLGRDLSEQDLLNIVRQSGDSSALTPQLIVSIVGEHCGVATKDILGEKRNPDLVQARQIAMYLCRELLGHSYPVIGRMFGGKDHSTVMHGVKKIKLLQEHDRLTHTMVTELTKTCLERRG